MLQNNWAIILLFNTKNLYKVRFFMYLRYFFNIFKLCKGNIINCNLTSQKKFFILVKELFTFIQLTLLTTHRAEIIRAPVNANSSLRANSSVGFKIDAQIALLAQTFLARIVVRHWINKTVASRKRRSSQQRVAPFLVIWHTSLLFP